MNRIRRLLQLPVADQVLLLQTLPLVVLVRFGLWCLSFKTMLRWIEHYSTRGGANRHQQLTAARRLAWAVKTVSRFVPAASCLTQALAAQVLLRRHGHAVELRIGVAKNSKGQLEAHAWLEDHAGIVIGNVPNLTQYIQLPALRAARS